MIRSRTTASGLATSQHLAVCALHPSLMVAKGQSDLRVGDNFTSMQAPASKGRPGGSSESKLRRHKKKILHAPAFKQIANANIVIVKVEALIKWGHAHLLRQLWLQVHNL